MFRKPGFFTELAACVVDNYYDTAHRPIVVKRNKKHVDMFKFL